MGTNIYVQLPGCPSACEHCAQARRVHLGKFSVGWPFTFAAPELADDAYDEWLRLAKSGPITTEYGTPYDLEDLLRAIEDRRDTPVPLGSGEHHIIRDAQGRRWMAGEFC